jgi:hypothetical protein
MNAPDKPELGAPSMPHMVQLLWKRAVGGLREEEVEWLAGSLEEAERATRNLAAMVEGVGILIAGDESTGVFQDKGDVPDLLFHIGQSLDHIEALIAIGDHAVDTLGKYRRLAERRGGAV